MGARESRIARIETWMARFDLEHPLQLGHMRITRRDYVVLRITTSDGVTGIAYCLSRNAPVDIAIADLIAPVLLGRPSGDIAGAAAAVRTATAVVGWGGILARAASLVDVALWDIAAKHDGRPVWALLSDSGPESAPVMLVEGYPRVVEGAEDFASRVAGRVASGFDWFKLANIPDADEMTRRLALTRAAVGATTHLVVDVAWLWSTDVGAAITTAERWADADLAWIEDPARVSEAAVYSQLRAGVSTPIGAGDEALDPADTIALAASRSIDVVRLDPMTGGGVTGFAAQHAAAVALGVPVSPHIYPELTRHFALAWPTVGPVEWYGPSGEFDRSAAFVHLVDGSFDGGVATRPHAPGIGFDIDWTALEAASVRHTNTTEEEL